jgi:hypothetical protein
MNMVEKWLVTFGFNKEFLGTSNSITMEPTQIRPCTRKIKEPNMNQVVPYHIWWSKVEKKNVGSGVDLMKNNTTP